MYKFITKSLVLLNIFSGYFFIQAMEEFIDQPDEPGLFIKNETDYPFEIENTNLNNQKFTKKIDINETTFIDKLNEIENLKIYYKSTVLGTYEKSLINALERVKKETINHPKQDVSLTISQLGEYGYLGWNFDPKISSIGWEKIQPERRLIKPKPEEYEAKVTIHDKDTLQLALQTLDAKNYLESIKKQQPRQILALSEEEEPLTRAEISKAFRPLASKWHPDINKEIPASLAEEIFKIINNAKDELFKEAQ